MHSHSAPTTETAPPSTTHHTYILPLPPITPFTNLQFLALASAFVGIQFCWAVQIGYVTKSLLELGLQPRYVSYAWLAGPIGGLFAQPIVGVISDRCTSKWGRRRPFLIGGTAITAICLILFAYAAQIDRMLNGGDSHALVIALISFWVLDFAINSAQGPMRALLADVVPPDQHTKGNAYFAFATGVGNCLGSFLGAIPLTRYLTVFPDDLQALYTITAFVLIVCVAVTVIFIKEPPLSITPYQLQTDHIENPPYETVPPSVPSHTTAESPHIGFFNAGLIAPYPFWHAFLVQCFMWFGWFALFVFGTSWVGKEVFNGNFDSPKGTEPRELYDAGVRLGNLGIGLQSILTIVSSLFLPSLLRRTTKQKVYFSASILLGIALSTTLLLRYKWQAWLATALIASTGFAWAVTMTVPWSLMSEAVARTAPERAGIYFTMFNLSQCLPEIILSLVAEEVERKTNSQATMMALGGVSVFVGAAVILILGLGKKEAEEDGAEARRLTALSSMESLG